MRENLKAVFTNGVRKGGKLGSLLKSSSLGRLCAAAKIEALNEYKMDIAFLQRTWFNEMYPGENYAVPTVELAAKLLTVTNKIVQVVDTEIENLTK